MAKKGSGRFIMTFSLLVASACLTFVHRTFFDERERIIPMGEGSFVTVRFSPRGEGLALALESIKVAKEQICLHAYSFTSKPITSALIAAHERGVKVAVMADRRESKQRYCRLRELADAGIPVYIDKVAGLAHNKVIIVDDQWVVTGSFNWSAAAEERNAENILCIKSRELNRIYYKNWEKRLARAERYIKRGDRSSTEGL